MPNTPANTRPGRGEGWTGAQIESLADADVEEMRRDPSEPRAYVRRTHPFLAALLDAEEQTKE